MQLLLLTLDERYLLTAAPPDLEHGVAPLGPPAPMQPLLFGLLLYNHKGFDLGDNLNGLFVFPTFFYFSLNLAIRNS